MEHRDFIKQHPTVPPSAFSGYYELRALDHLRQIEVLLGSFKTEEEAVSIANFYGRNTMGLTVFVMYKQYIVN